MSRNPFIIFIILGRRMVAAIRRIHSSG